MVIDCAKLITVYEYVLYRRRARIQLRKTLGAPPAPEIPARISWDLSNTECPFRFIASLPGTGVVPVNPPASASTHLHPQDTGNPRIRPPLALAGAFSVAIQRDGGLATVALYLQHVACKVTQKGEKEQGKVLCFLTTLVLR